MVLPPLIPPTSIPHPASPFSPCHYANLPRVMEGPLAGHHHPLQWQPGYSQRRVILATTLKWMMPPERYFQPQIGQAHPAGWTYELWLNQTTGLSASVSTDSSRVLVRLPGHARDWSGDFMHAELMPTLFPNSACSVECLSFVFLNGNFPHSSLQTPFETPQVSKAAWHRALLLKGGKFKSLLGNSERVAILGILVSVFEFTRIAYIKDVCYKNTCSCTRFLFLSIA